MPSRGLHYQIETISIGTNLASGRGIHIDKLSIRIKCFRSSTNTHCSVTTSVTRPLVLQVQYEYTAVTWRCSNFITSRVPANFENSTSTFVAVYQLTSLKKYTVGLGKPSWHNSFSCETTSKLHKEKPIHFQTCRTEIEETLLHQKTTNA